MEGHDTLTVALWTYSTHSTWRKQKDGSRNIRVPAWCQFVASGFSTQSACWHYSHALPNHCHHFFSTWLPYYLARWGHHHIFSSISELHRLSHPSSYHFLSNIAGWPRHSTVPALFGWHGSRNSDSTRTKFKKLCHAFTGDNLHLSTHPCVITVFQLSLTLAFNYHHS